MTDVPKWACASLSAELPSLREQGETPTVDFKEDFPAQNTKLAKEVAGMATSGGGRIFLGINDNGDLCGLPNSDTTEQRDEHVDKATSIVRMVRPIPKDVTIEFAVESALPVLVIGVPQQLHAPVFYSEYRPYVRNQRQAIPATPEEVVELIWEHPSAEHKRAMQDLQLRERELEVKQSEDFVSQMNTLRNNSIRGY